MLAGMASLSFHQVLFVCLFVYACTRVFFLPSSSLSLCLRSLTRSMSALRINLEKAHKCNSNLLGRTKDQSSNI
ncbi:hypothetical protein BC939DRAFT_465543 [Gamsiella multidivaricata]|uniref:uncharacterized protein n=1 Tax=Gamsiella multidivaricata TaxID=101098 RepID=UPI002220C27A|nr:uncharacterized protein BC939DRAFT_465543 [Gamsiella multidivaricata]KAI7817586.1 hypothetical protein BC939DRAFT_465543 [Gamsiella multidivaricata]